MTKPILVRMPPSPTGKLHLGTARTALFNWLFAKHHGGKIIFRWEDTDKERSQTEYETEILEGLKWLGMDFVDDSDGFYRQSEEADSHAQWLETLWHNEQIFPCFVTKEEIDAQREQAAKEKRNFVFWSPYRDTDRSELEAEMKSGQPFVWRLRCPKGEALQFTDLVRGEIETSSDTIGDFVVARSDGSVLYLLANVIDDWQQGVTHILRGEDHISNTPKQLLVYQALEAPLPEFGHIPLVFDHNRRKLSKRNVLPGVCVLIDDFRKNGFVPEAVVNGLALLGWNPKTEQEIFSFGELIAQFSLEKVNPGAAQYNWDKMQWLNAQWIKQLDLATLVEHYNQFSGTEYGEAHHRHFEVVRAKARFLTDIGNHLAYLETDPGFDDGLLVNEKMGIDQAIARQMLSAAQAMVEAMSADSFSASEIREAAIGKIAELGVKNGQFLSPLRVALSNRSVSVGPFDIAALIGKAETLKRIERAMGA